MISPEDYIEQRLTDQINRYDRKSGSNQRWFKRLRFAEIVAAATIPTLIGSAAYAIAETFRWAQGLNEKFNTARVFYSDSRCIACAF